MSLKQKEGQLCTEFEIPKTCVISEGDQLIKELINKQLNKNIQLHNELTRINHFERPTKLINETESLIGKSTLKEFKKHAEHLKQIHDLKSVGLTDTEIKLYLNHYQHGKNTFNELFAESIKNKLQSNNESEPTNLKNSLVSRHLKELGLSTKPESLETKLFKFATSCSHKDAVDTPSAHPINKLEEIEKELFSHLKNPKVPLLKKRRKKAKKYLDPTDDFNANISSNLNTNWDVQDIPKSSVKYVKKHSNFYSSTFKRKYTIMNNEIVEINKLENYKDVNSTKTEGQIFISGEINDKFYYLGEKLTEEEIKKMTRFQNYEKGIPSNILFIKNMAKHTNEQDLINLFNRFDNEPNKITYRLLTGKMKGQAFVTFNNIKQATVALESLNGIVLKNKPLIIQYGKTNTVSTN